MLLTIEWKNDALRLVDQTRLPMEIAYVDLIDEKQVWDAIKRLVVRGAPAIGVAAAFGAYLGVRRLRADDARGWIDGLQRVCAYLATSRPTAVNLFWALRRIENIGRAAIANGVAAANARVFQECMTMWEEDQTACRGIGEQGLPLLQEASDGDEVINVLTHCNAGGLAAVRFGMSLAPIYVGAERGVNFHVYCDETRPLLQGSRITAMELMAANIPATVICDNMAASVMQSGKVHAVVVGTDRVAANGDVANKIGTLGVAILAKHFGVPFFVTSPTSTIDLQATSGKAIPIEERDAREITHGFGRQTAPDGVGVFNPAFDVTPAELVTAIITERGVIRPPYSQSIAALMAGA